ncbi:MAG: anti-sigma factor domain-containing protein, partial [Solirubrobacteraceae bacterium]
YQGDGGFIDDPMLAARNLAYAARHHGAEFRFGQAGVALDGDGGRTYAVTVDREQAPAASAELHVLDGEAMLVAEGLPAPPEGRVYQVWIKRPGIEAPEPTSALFLPRSDGSAAAAVPGDLAEMEAVLVTHEPRGGSRAPTRAPLLSAPMS